MNLIETSCLTEQIHFSPRLTKAKRRATAKRTEKRAELFAKYDQDIGTLGHWDIGGFGMDWTMIGL